MSVLETRSLSQETFSGKYIFLDNDFLALLFSDYAALEKLIELAKFGTLLVDPLTKFEFLQTIFLPEQRQLKEDFINSHVFLPAVDHQTVFRQIRENALTLSYLYAHHGTKSAGFIDLCLAGRALLHAPNSIIFTGNRKDFPECIFDLVGAFVKDQPDGNIRSYSALTFSRPKYDEAVRSWHDL